MEHQKNIIIFLNKASDPKSLTRKWNIVNDQSNTNYHVGNYISYKAEVLKSNLCDYNDAYILLRGDIITAAHNNLTLVAFKNCVPFTKCITKIDGKTVDYAENLDLVVPIYNFIEYTSSYSNTTSRLWFYSTDEANNMILTL